MLEKKIGARLILPILLLLAVLWYRFVFVQTKDQIESLNAQREDVEMNLTIEQGRNAKMKQMQNELETLKNQEAVTEIAEYDNIRNVMDSLNTILAAADDYDVTFAEPEQDEETGLYRRRVSLTFSTDSMEESDAIIRKLYKSPYRCVIDTLSMQAQDSAGDNDGALSLSSDGNQVSMEIVYYEIDAQ